MPKFRNLCIYGLGFLFISCVLSCNSKEKPKSELFYQIFKTDSTTFRGSTPGDAFSLAQKNELPTMPKDENDLGIAYEFPLGEKRELFVEYYKKEDRIASIIANVYLEDEVTTIRLYQEIQEYYNSIEDYALTNGSFGNYMWESRTQNNSRMEIYLELEDNKTGITLTFLDTRIDS